MANSGRRKVRYKPRLSDDEAYDRLPPTLRKAMQDSVNCWSAYSALKSFNKRGLKATLAAIKAGDENFMRKGWVRAKGKRKAMPSSYVACGVKPLRNFALAV